MKQLLVAIASGAVGAAVALSFARPETPPARTTVRAQPMDLAGLEAAFRRALRDVPLVRAVPPEEAAAAPAPGPIRGSGPAATVAPGAGLPPARLDVLAQVASFESDSGLRRSWILRGESDVLDWLGTPDRIEAGGGIERWVYDLPDGPGVCVRFHRGRVINVYRG